MDTSGPSVDRTIEVGACVRKLGRKTRTDVTDPVFSHSLTHKAIPCLNDTYRTPPQQVMHTHRRPANISTMLVTVRELRSQPVLRATLLVVLFEYLRGVALLGLVQRSC